MSNYLLKWNEYKEKRPFKAYFIMFTLLFFITIFLFYASFIFNEKSFIWKGSTKDGLVQHYNALMYFGRYLRSILYNLFVNHQFDIPLYDFSIGYGSDILTSLHYYVMGDPLNLLSVFVSSKYTEYLYAFLVVLRLYLSGLSFSYYCFQLKKDSKSTLVGALTYIFCGYVIFASVRHPYFINPMIYLPLLLLGTERILHNRSPKLFIIVLTISAISNFYFLYMLCLVVFIYAVIRFLFIYHFKVKLGIKYFFKFVTNGVIALCMSAFILLPVIYFFFQTARSEYKIAFDSFYSLSYYLSCFLNFNSYNFAEYWTIFGYNSLSLLCVFILFIRKGNYSLKIGFIISTLFICLPYAGYVFNGFSYVSNRWEFAYSFVIALITCSMFQRLFTMEKKECILTGLFVFIYIFIAGLFSETRNFNFIISAIILIMTYIILLIRNRLWFNQKIGLSLNRISLICIIALLISNVSVNAYYKYSPQHLNYIKEFVDAKKGFSNLTKTRAQVIKKLNDSTFYRYDETNFGKYYLTNASLQQRQKSISFFYSLGSGYITDYFMEMQNINALSSIYTGVNYRAYLDALASVKYFAAEKNQEQYRPYGFDKKVYDSEKFSVFQSDLYLPLGYTYNQQISQKDFNNASAIEKQQMLMQGVYIDDDIQSFQLNNAQVSLANQQVPYQIVHSDGIRKTTQGFDVIKKNAKLTIRFNPVVESELYLLFHDLSFLPYKNEKEKYVNQAKISISSHNIKDTIILKNKYHTYYNGTEYFLMNLGYSRENRNEITIEFKTIGSYICKDMSVETLPMKQFDYQVKELKENCLENVEMGVNTVSGTIHTEENKFLCFSIPYSDGWKAYVNGKEVELYRANIMYMGLPLEKGKHTIQLVYSTPYLKQGVIISGIGIISFLGIIYYERKKKIIRIC